RGFGGQPLQPAAHSGGARPHLRSAPPLPQEALPPIAIRTALTECRPQNCERNAPRICWHTHATISPAGIRKRRCWHQELNECPPDEAEIHAVAMACRTTVGYHR